MRWAIVGAVVIAGGVAAADDAPAFGSRGVAEINAGTSLSATYETVRPPKGPSYSNKFFGVTASAAYFVSDGLSIGGLVSLSYSSVASHDMYTGGDETSIALGPSVGYNVWLRPQLVSLWPQAAMTYDHTTTSYPDFPSATTSAFVVGAIVPLVIHPAPHFFFEVGPAFYTQLSNRYSSGGVSMDEPKTTTIRLFAAIGGWL